MRTPPLRRRIGNSTPSLHAVGPTAGPPRPALRQRGLTLPEVAIGLAALGLLSVVVATTLQQLQERTTVDEDRGMVLQAQHAVLGAAQAELHFPLPDGAGPSPGRPGYLEGWLPAGALGLPPSRRVRYLVDASLVGVPASADLYRADPYQLAGGLVSARSTPALLDLCFRLMQRERAGSALPGGMRAAFALQEVLGAGRAGGEVAQLWLGDGASAAPPPQQQYSTAMLGYAESTQALGCLDRFSRLAARVKGAAVAADLKKMAALNVEFRDLAVKGAHEGVVNLQRKKAIWTVKTARMAIGQAQATIALRSTTASAAGIAAAMVAQAAAVTALVGAVFFLKQIDAGAVAASGSEDASRSALAESVLYDASVDRLWRDEAARANILQGGAP